MLALAIVCSVVIAIDVINFTAMVFVIAIVVVILIFLSLFLCLYVI
jgi:hypothetical protein